MDCRWFFEKHAMTFPMRETEPGVFEFMAFGDSHEVFKLTENNRFTYEGLVFLNTMQRMVLPQFMQRIDRIVEEMETRKLTGEEKEFQAFRKHQQNAYLDFNDDISKILVEYADLLKVHKSELDS
jgi:hypothetical protein